MLVKLSKPLLIGNSFMQLSKIEFIKIDFLQSENNYTFILFLINCRWEINKIFRGGI